MKLIPEQISYLRKQQTELKQSIAGYQDYLGQRETTSSDYSSRALIGDTLIDEQYQRTQTSYREVTSLLERSEYITKRDTDRVQIGTKFIVEFTGMPSTNAVILTDGMFSLMGDRTFVSSSSPLGKSVLGKQEGDKIQYTLPGTSRIGNRVVGTIKEIKKLPSDYLQFIRNKELKNRMAWNVRKELRELNASEQEEDKEEYARRHELTESQRQLLLIDKEMTERQPKTQSTISRLASINKMLSTAKIATPPTDGTIGIGSTFDIVITDGTTSEERHYEMINYAVSTELEDAYVERIDTLGSKLFGKRQNDQISFIKGNKTYKAAVVNVDTPTKEASHEYRK